MPADRAFWRRSSPAHGDDAPVALPRTLADLVERCVRSSGIRGAEKRVVARELTSHLRDALEAGHSVECIIDEFGDPVQTGLLIGRARSRLGRGGIMAAARTTALGAAAAVVCLYAASAAALHSGMPPRGVWVREDIPAALLDPAALDPRAASRLVDTLLARMYTNDGDGRGHLTAAGLRIVQLLKGVDRPSTAGLAFEPVYFVFPAHRGAVRREADRVLRIAEHARANGPGSAAWSDFEREVERFRWTRPSAYRYVPLAIVMPRLAVAMRAAN